ncbi:MAG: 2Fe-2S iron-sulfur cluster-binding protein, partial [Ktedonobacterales bacterium]
MHKAVNQWRWRSHMPDTPLTLTVDGVEIEAIPGQTIIQACDAAGIYI